jgi:ribonuclease HII
MKWTVGIDEVGRGPIAGPVTVCIFITNSKIKLKSLFPNQIIRDSKKTKKHIRESINLSIRNLRESRYSEIDWVIVSKSANYIDKHGIANAIESCISSGILTLTRRGYDLTDAKVYLDGGLRLKNQDITQKTIIKGDEKHAHIAMASILAKVHRDNYMLNLSIKHKNYSWDTNAGYGTRLHYEAMRLHGLTKYHRRSFLN